jgi:hypothetical protein
MVVEKDFDTGIYYLDCIFILDISAWLLEDEDFFLISCLVSLSNSCNRVLEIFVIRLSIAAIKLLLHLWMGQMMREESVWERKKCKNHGVENCSSKFSVAHNSCTPRTHSTRFDFAFNWINRFARINKINWYPYLRSNLNEEIMVIVVNLL